MNKSILLIYENLRFAQNLQQYFQAQDVLLSMVVNPFIHCTGSEVEKMSAKGLELELENAR